MDYDEILVFASRHAISGRRSWRCGQRARRTKGKLEADMRTTVLITTLMLAIASAAGGMAAQQDVTDAEAAEAVARYRQAAEEGDPDAQFELGEAYSFGRGVAQDDADAFAWYWRAAEQGHVGAQVVLGIAYRSGWVVAQDAAEAVAWFRRAAEQGDAYAQLALGS